jgi:hypothetical protein
VCICLLLGPAAATSGLEAPSFAKADNLANQMGLFLQKTNIIRDYLVSVMLGLSCWDSKSCCPSKQGGHPTAHVQGAQLVEPGVAYTLVSSGEAPPVYILQALLATCMCGCEVCAKQHPGRQAGGQ